jgi:hypothetical protein
MAKLRCLLRATMSMPRARGGVRLGFDHPAFVDEMGDDGALDVALPEPLGHGDSLAIGLCERSPRPALVGGENGRSEGGSGQHGAVLSLWAPPAGAAASIAAAVDEIGD